MKKINTFSLLFIIMTFVLSGCAVSETGNSLHAFTERMNKISESYSLTENGYIFNDTDNTFTRFYKFNTNEIMVQFTCDENNNLYRLDLVFPKECAKNPQEIKFIKDCICAYIKNTETQTDLMNKLQFDNTLNEVNYETQKAESGDTEMLIDVTAIGTVITIIQNNL